MQKPGDNPLVLGVNPLFGARANEAYDNDSDGASSSGDEILIGIEDRDDFRDYKGHRHVRDILNCLKCNVSICNISTC